MSTPEKRVQELHLTFPPAPKPVAVYKTAVKIGNLLYVSGHGPLKADKSLITGRLGKDMTLDQGKEAAMRERPMSTLRQAWAERPPRSSSERESLRIRQTVHYQRARTADSGRPGQTRSIRPEEASRPHWRGVPVVSFRRSWVHPPDRGIENRCEGDPCKVRHQQDGRDGGGAPKGNDRRQDGKPEQNDVGEGQARVA